MTVSQAGESVGDSVDRPDGDSSQPLPDNCRPRRPPRSATTTGHGPASPGYRPLSQGPFPWSPYHLYRADEASRALEGVELHHLSESANGEGTPRPECDVDLSD